MRLFALLCAGVLACAAPCQPVDRDRIVAADIAERIELFARLDPALPLGLTPLPGARRTFSGRELAAIAKRHDLASGQPLPDVCFERKLAPLTPDGIRAAMEAALGSADAGIEVLDFARQPVPSGELVFLRSGLTPPPAAAPDSPVIWRGSLRYGPQHSLPLWASVRITEQRAVVTAAREIRYGAAISPADIVLVRRNCFPFAPYLDSEAAALGRIARKTIPAGASISNAWLEVPIDVASGDAVRVVAAEGSARITFDAVARSPGRKGDRILLLNPQSGRSFRALVDGKGCAHTGAGAEHVYE